MLDIESLKSRSGSLDSPHCPAGLPFQHQASYGVPRGFAHPLKTATHESGVRRKAELEEGRPRQDAGAFRNREPSSCTRGCRDASAVQGFLERRFGMGLVGPWFHRAGPDLRVLSCAKSTSPFLAQVTADLQKRAFQARLCSCPAEPVLF